MALKLARDEYTKQYTKEVFGQQDAHLAGLMEDAVKAGLPAIAVSSDVGRLLTLLTRMTRGHLAIELGTLAGYSGIWIARGLAPDGALITVEIDDKHADFAQAQFQKAGVAEQVRLVRGAALDVLAQLGRELPAESVDLLFFDAVKTEYPEYWRLARPLLAPGGLLVCDNVLGANWWIDEVGHPVRDAVDAFNRSVAADATLDVACVPLREGVLVARKR